MTLWKKNRVQRVDELMTRGDGEYGNGTSCIQPWEMATLSHSMNVASQKK